MCGYFHIVYVVQPMTIVGDLSKESDVERVIDTTVKQFGQIDILVSYFVTGSKYFLRLTHVNLLPWQMIEIHSFPKRQAVNYISIVCLLLDYFQYTLCLYEIFVHSVDNKRCLFVMHLNLQF